MTKQTQSVPVWLWAACYALWIALFLSGFFLIGQVRSVLTSLGELTPANYWMISAADRYALLLLGVVWLVLTLALEAYLRAGVHKGLFWPRAGRVVLWVVGLLAVTSAAQYLLDR